MNVYVRVTKRIMDLVISSIVIVCGAIPIALLCMLIVWETPGSPFYTQRRLKRHFSNDIKKKTDLHAIPTFNIIKLRTMRDGAESLLGPVNASEDDPRVTRIGKFLRKTRLDELPNFINVFLGDMSVVGPRADRPEIIEKVLPLFPNLTERTRNLKPGITGLAQIHLKSNGSLDQQRGIRQCIIDGDQPAESFRFKLYYEAAYMIKLSNFWNFLITDIKIMIKTPMVMFFKRNVV